MKKFYLLGVIVIVFVSLTASERGLTCTELSDPAPAVYRREQIKDYYPPKTEIHLAEIQEIRDEWIQIDELKLNLLLHPGKYVGYAYNAAMESLEIVTDQIQIINLAQEAVAYAPSWLGADLKNIFSQLNTNYQEIWAEIILNTDHPYIDEVAYSIAHSSAAYLISEFYHQDLFLQNASLIYEIDQDLDYVEVVDYGTPGSDSDFYTTTRYLKLNENDEIVEIEVPRDIYYMYLVHPKNTDEIPAYIDPDIIESNINHQNNIADPPDGVFWRDFLYNHNDEGYPLLKDYLMACEVAWDSESLSPSNAIGAISTWLAESLVFTSDAERPHQPVRIYRKHIGRCGEHADMRSAAARTALIPCTSILTISTDHTWNEFWDEEWIHWDSPEINNPLVYENGWGKVHASVFEIKSNGYLTPVSAKYSEGSANLVVYVFDPNNNPVDGARILLGVQDGSDILGDNVGFTDNDGKYDFEVGENRTYYAKMTSPLGDVNDYQLLVENVQDGDSLNFSFSVLNYMPTIDFNEISTPLDSEDDYLMAVSFEIPEQIIHGNIVFDDIDNSEFFNGKEEGSLNYFMFDLINFSSYVAGYLFDSFNTGYGTNGEEVDFFMPIPEFGYWYALMDNSLRIANPQKISGDIFLYEYEESYNNSDILPKVITLTNYPNPFNPTTTIGYYLPQDSWVELNIYNLKGELLSCLIHEFQTSGKHNLTWEATSYDSGIYFYEIKFGDKTLRKKMCLLK